LLIQLLVVYLQALQKVLVFDKPNILFIHSVMSQRLMFLEKKFCA